MRPGKDRGKDWSQAATSQGTPEPPKPEEAMKVLPQGFQREPSLWSLGLQEKLFLLF